MHLHHWIRKLDNVAVTGRPISTGRIQKTKDLCASGMAFVIGKHLFRIAMVWADIFQRRFANHDQNAGRTTAENQRRNSIM